MLRYSGDTIQNYSDDIYSVFLYDNTYTGDCSTFKIAKEGLNIDRPTITDKFQVIRAADCTLILISEFPDQFDWLRTAELQRFKIVIKCNSAVVFEGYLKTEQFSTTMSESVYTIEFHFNNSLSLLKRYKLTDDSEQRIKGNVTTQWQLLQYCLNKLNYEYLDNLYMCLSTTCQQITTASGETLLHKTFIITDNYYDEENEPVNCYEAVEMLLKCYTANIRQFGNNLVIVDNETELNDSVDFIKYSLVDYTYQGTETLNLSAGDLSDYDSSDVEKELVSSYNSVKLDYSPYYSNTLFTYEPTQVDITNTGTTVNVGTDNNYKFKYNYYLDSEIVNYSGTTKLALVKGTGQENGNKSEFVLIKQQPSNNSIAFDFNYEFPFLIVPNQTICKLKLGVQAYFRTKDAYQAPENIIATYGSLLDVHLHVQILMDDKIFQNNTYGSGRWDTYTGGTGQYYILPYYFKSDAYEDFTIPVGDQWLNCKHNAIVDTESQVLDYVYIPLYTYWPDYLGVNGKLSFKILDSYEAYGNDYLDVRSHVKDIWINKVEIVLQDKQGNELAQNDVQFEAFMNPSFENEASNLKLQQSDSMYYTVGERGALYYSGDTNYDFIQTHTRAGVQANLSKLFLRSWLSNYNDFTNNLTATINATPGLLGNMTYDQLPGKKFIIGGIKSNVIKNQHQITLMEVLPDSETITEV